MQFTVTPHVPVLLKRLWEDMQAHVQIAIIHACRNSVAVAYIACKGGRTFIANNLAMNPPPGHMIKVPPVKV